MSTVKFNDRSYVLAQEESLLHCLLRYGIEYPHSCQAGICQSCLIKATDGIVDPAWQAGLPETLKIQGYLLACLAKPKDLLHVIEPASSECESDAKIIDLKLLNHNVMQLKLHVENLAAWIPGQYLNLINPEGVMRSYSIANIPAQDGFIELQIKIYPKGNMGHWLINHAIKQTKIKIRGPFGRCFYHNPEQVPFDILLAGTGTGLAPLIAIIKSALSQKHQGNIILIHGGLVDEDIYYQKELETLSARFSSFVYDPCVLESQGKYPVAAIDKRVLTHLKQPKKTRVYVCGPKETTNKLKKQIFLAGVPSNEIYSDVFV